MLLGVLIGGSGAATVAGASELQQPPTSYPLCTGIQLAGFPWTHKAFGRAIPGIGLRNMSLSICRVAGFPRVRVYESTGRLARIRIERHMFADTKIYAYTVTPGSAVFFAFYGNPPRGEFDRSCIGISQIDILLPDDAHPIDVTLASGTCGDHMTVSQMFAAGELSL